MEPNNELIPETEIETNTDLNAEQEPNLAICPNCLEPNTDGLAVCKYCGMPLHPGADEGDFVPPEDEKTLEANRAAATAVDEKAKAKKDDKKEESGFRRVMPYLGLYIIYYAITGIIETSRQEELSNPTLAYLSWVVYIIAGLLMAFPLIKKGYYKLFPNRIKVEEDTEEEQSEETAPEAIEADEEMVNAAALAMNGESEAAVYSAAEIMEEETASGLNAENEISAEAEAMLKKNSTAYTGGVHEESIEDEGENAYWL